MCSGCSRKRRRRTSTARDDPPRPRSCRSTVRRAATHHRQRARDRRASLGQPSLERFATQPTSAERLIVCPMRSGSGPRACRRRTTSPRSPMWFEDLITSGKPPATVTRLRRPVHRRPIRGGGFPRALELADFPGGIPRSSNHGAGKAPGVDVEAGDAPTLIRRDSRMGSTDVRRLSTE